MNNKYAIINIEAIQNRIEELEMEQEKNHLLNVEKFNCLISEIKAYKNILSQSTPLIPEIEKAFDEGKSVGIISYQPRWATLDKELYNERKQDYISNLKLDI